jgi:hypothetical protein
MTFFFFSSPIRVYFDGVDEEIAQFICKLVSFLSLPQSNGTQQKNAERLNIFSFSLHAASNKY